MTDNSQINCCYYNGLEYYCPFMRTPFYSGESELKTMPFKQKPHVETMPNTKAPKKKLSARNQFRGRVTKITKGDVVGQVIVDIGCGNFISSVITTASIEELGLKIGSEVTAFIKSSSVMITTHEMKPLPSSGSKISLSARNQFKGRVAQITKGDVVGQVTVDIGCGNLMSATITTASINELGIRVGSEVIAIAKSTDVMIMI